MLEKHCPSEMKFIMPLVSPCDHPRSVFVFGFEKELLFGSKLWTQKSHGAI